MPEKSKKDHNARYGLFLKLYRQNESVLFGFIMKLLPNFSVAEDIMQEVLIVMWEKFDTFREGTSFISWAKQIARYKVMNFIRKDAGSDVIHFDDNLIEQITRLDDDLPFQESYYESVHSCIDKLEESAKKVVHLRYTKNMRIGDIAESLGLTPNTLSQRMARIHFVLRRCIDRTMQEAVNG